jgi:putative ABC transport system substrate-binding protein
VLSTVPRPAALLMRRSTRRGPCPLRGGVLAYGSNVANMFRHPATHVDKILKGAKPVDVRVEEPIIFELVINPKAAKALGLTIPRRCCYADELIQRS